MRGKLTMVANFCHHQLDVLENVLHCDCCLRYSLQKTTRPAKIANSIFAKEMLIERLN
jgi:hypothetical protein